MKLISEGKKILKIITVIQLGKIWNYDGGKIEDIYNI